MKSINNYIIITLSLIITISCSDNSKAIDTVNKSPVDKKQTEIKLVNNINLNKNELKKYKPNELGWVMILEYHKIGNPEERWMRTPENFRKDLERLYKEGYYLTPLNDFVNNKMNVPAGKSPVILTFDDGTEGQFRYKKSAKEKIIDSSSAVGIIENFCKTHSDFGKAGTFYVLPRLSFGQTQEDAKQKLRFLSENGYEIGNHTVAHTNLNIASEEKIQEDIGGHIKLIQSVLPDYQVKTIAYPYGGVPKNINIVKNGNYKGTKYENIAGLLVGAEPSVSPNSKKFAPMFLPRIQAIQSELDKFLGLFKNYPYLRYISDGNPDTITIPDKLPDFLKKTLKEELKKSQALIKY